MGFYLPETLWPYAFGTLVLFITAIMAFLHLAYNRLGQTNDLLIATLHSKNTLLASNQHLQTSIDNLLANSEELFACLQEAKTGEERTQCMMRIAMGGRSE